MMKQLGALALVLGLLTGCLATFEAETPAQRVFAAKADFKAIIIPANEYESLPRCAEGETTLIDGACSDTGIVALIRKSAEHTKTVLDRAENVVRDEASSQSAIAQWVRFGEEALAALREILLKEGII